MQIQKVADEFVIHVARLGDVMDFLYDIASQAKSEGVRYISIFCPGKQPATISVNGCLRIGKRGKLKYPNSERLDS